MDTRKKGYCKVWKGERKRDDMGNEVFFFFFLIFCALIVGRFGIGIYFGIGSDWFVNGFWVGIYQNVFSK